MALPRLFPVPRYSRELPGRAGGEVRYAVDPALPAQGYELQADATGIQLLHADEAGRRYGEATLDQLRSDDGTVPAVLIRDWPDVAVRGYMLDCSRDRVPTRATLERLVGILALARFNHLQLYLEHTFAHPGHEVVWQDASPLDGADLERLDAVCRDHGIELAVNQNCFGHMERWLRHEPYRHRAECPDGFDFLGRHRGPSVLAPTDANAEFVLELVRNQLGHVRSRTVNIGCDETFELGLGASAPAAAERGAAAVYVEHLRRIVEPLLADGLAVQFWGDIVRSHPELLPALPDGDLTAVAWTYNAPTEAPPDTPSALKEMLAKLGIDQDAHRGFVTNAAPFAEAGIPFWVAPGTSSWNSIIGRLDNARGNLLDAATNGVRLGAGGYLVTDWGDNGHHQPPAVSFPPIVYGGAVAWGAEANADLDVAAIVDERIVLDGTGRIGAVLERLGTMWRRTGFHAMNGSPLFTGLCRHTGGITGGEADPAGIESVVADLDDCVVELSRAEPRSPDGAVVVDELQVAAGLARHGAWQLLRRAEAAAPPPAALRDDLRSLIERYQAAWLQRSRPGGLTDSVAHLERTLAKLA